MEIFISLSSAMPDDIDNLYLYVESLEESIDSLQDSIDSLESMDTMEDLEEDIVDKPAKAKRLRAQLAEATKKLAKANKRIVTLEEADI